MKFFTHNLQIVCQTLYLLCEIIYDKSSNSIFNEKKVSSTCCTYNKRYPNKNVCGEIEADK